MKARIILADNPWRYNDRKSTRRDNPTKSSKFGIGVARRYVQTLSVDQLAELSPLVQAVAAPDAYLFLWATCPLLPDALEVMRLWGWRYVGVPFQWTKSTSAGACWKGPGRYVPSNMEIVLLGVRGRPWHPATGPKPVQEVRQPHPRAGGKIIHSRKPDDVHERIESWLDPHLGEHFKLELFATKPRAGWTCLGHDVTGKDIRYDLKSLGTPKQ